MIMSYVEWITAPRVRECGREKKNHFPKVLPNSFSTSPDPNRAVSTPQTPHEGTQHCASAVVDAAQNNPFRWSLDMLRCGRGWRRKDVPILPGFVGSSRLELHIWYKRLPGSALSSTPQGPSCLDSEMPLDLLDSVDQAN